MLANIKKSSLNLSKAYGLALCGILIAMYVVFRAITIPITPDNRISLTFVPMAVAGYLLGPIPAMLIGTLGDLIAYLFSPQGAYFPGFTLSAALTGLVYGLCLYNKPAKKMILWVIVSRVVITFGINIVLNTFWLSIMYEKAYTILSAARIVKNFIGFPIEIIVTFSLLTLLNKMNVRKKL